jgi:large subunit ribosomal protein L20
MPRVKGGPRQKNKHKKILKLAKGYRGTRSKLYKRASEAVVRSGKHAFEGRRQRRRDIRVLWISRINAALTAYDIKYSRFINGLNKSKLGLNRKMLSEMAINDPKGFEKVVEAVKKHLN